MKRSYGWILAGIAAATAGIARLAFAGFPRITQARTYGYSELLGTLYALVGNLWVILIAVATIMFIIGGYRYLTAQGNAEQIKTANKTLLYGLIALAIGLVSRGLVFLVNDVVCVSGLVC